MEYVGICQSRITLSPNLILSSGGRSLKLTYPLCVVHIPPPPPCYHVTINLLFRFGVGFAHVAPICFLVMPTDPRTLAIFAFAFLPEVLAKARAPALPASVLLL